MASRKQGELDVRAGECACGSGRRGSHSSLGSVAGCFLSLTLGIGDSITFIFPSLSIQMPFHIRKLESALLMQDLLALLSNTTEE